MSNNELIKKQLDLVNESIKMYGIHNSIPHILIGAVYELYTTESEWFSVDNENYMFSLLNKLSKKYD